MLLCNRRLGTAVAALAMAGAAAPASAAHARAVVAVPCSTTALIADINAANTAGSGTLLLSSNCTYTLTAAAGAGRGPDGLPVITGNLIIIGGISTRIARSSAAPPFRVVEIAAGATLTLESLFVSGGNADATVPSNDTGGGILNSRGTLTLTFVTVTENTADSGAALSNDSGRAHMTNTLVEHNPTRVGGGGGGGFYNDGSLTVLNSMLLNNGANTSGGGGYNGQGGHTLMTSTTVQSNTAGTTGGGLYNATDGRLILNDTMVERNTAGNGGGIFNGGVSSRVTLNGSLVRHNVPNNCAPAGSVALCTG